MEHKKQRFPDSLLVLLLFGIFAACILSVLLTGADAYKRLTKRDEAQFECRTAMRYLETRLHQADEKNRIFLGDFDGNNRNQKENQVVFLEEMIDGVSYYTRVYFYDGYLRELFCRADIEMEPEDGEKIIPISGLEFQWEKRNLLYVRLLDSNENEQKIYYKIRSEKGGVL